MQQRRLRLGDILDDYCPRERRITNHVVVAMIDEDVKQTRCSTCDADHEYKHGKAPAPRRRKAGALFADAEGGEARPVLTAAHPAEHADSGPSDHSPEENDTTIAAAPEHDAADVVAAPESTPEEPEPASEDEGPVHRRLIRATLPRPEGQVPERKEPDFTYRHGGRFDQGNRNGHRARGGPRGMRAQGQSGSPTRFGGGQRHGQNGHGPAQGGQRQGQGNRGSRPAGGQGRGGPRPGGQGRKRGR